MPKISTALTPDQVLMRYYAALNTGDIDVALALFDDAAIRLDTAMPQQVVKGKTQIEAGLRARITDHVYIEATDYQVSENSVTCMAKVWTDYGRRLGFAPVEEKVEVTVERGLIRRFAVTVTPESLARIATAEANQ